MPESFPIGVAYYPEHWPLERRATDLRLMREAGFNVVRISEFDWVHMEPAEGNYNFEFWDTVLDDLTKAGLKAIMCTPTGSMPVWVAQQYPDVLAVKQNGQRIRWGVRKNNCFSSAKFRQLSKGITSAMAEHFAGHPAIIGWQIDNELQEPVCYCDNCKHSFQLWLQDKYSSIDTLNAAWGTHFWGHTLQDWKEIELPDYWLSNPSAFLDWKRHYSWLNVTFQREQIDILRKYFPDTFITHNFMGLFPQIDYHELANDLDVVSWDNYPVWNSQSIRYGASLTADLTRCHKNKNYWILEQTAGAPGGPTFMRNPWPGEIRSVAYQQLAHGCDGMTWFRWRTCTVGTEQFWHGLLSHDGKPLRRYQEAASTAREFQQLAPLLKDTTVKADVAILFDYESLWAIQIQPGFEHNDYRESIERYHRALFDAGVNVDVISPNTDFSRYKLIIATRQHILDDPLAEKFKSYVHNGGVLMTDARSAIKDACNRCHERTLPGLLSDMLGIRIEEYGSFGKREMKVPLTPHSPLPSGNYTAIDYADWIISESATSVAGYQHKYLGNYSALTRNQHGKGVAWYLGTVVEEELFYDSLIQSLLLDAHITPPVTTPHGVECSVRTSKDGSRKITFLLNHSSEEKEVVLTNDYLDAFTQNKVNRIVQLEPYGVSVLLNTN